MKKENREQKIKRSISTVIKYKRDNVGARELKNYMDLQGFNVYEYVYVLDKANEILNSLYKKNKT